MDTHTVDQSICYEVVIVGKLRQSQAALLLKRLVQISRARRHGCP